jgi:hypothetical protein
MSMWASLASMTTRLRSLPILLAMSALTLAGCSASTAAPASVNPTTTAPAGHKTAAGSGCANQIGVVKAKVTDPALRSIEATGVCTIVTLNTTLADADIDKAVTMCEAAATVAYVGGTTSVTVVGQSGKELATGLKGNPCIGEP